MIRAEIILLTRSSALSTPTEHRIRFDNFDNAKDEYTRVAALWNANDPPEILEVVGTVNRVSFPLEFLHSVALLDFLLADHHEQGLRKAFPSLFVPGGVL